MKVHPVPKKRNIALRYDVGSGLSDANRLVCRQKKLRRLPHIFARVLELPFHADADVSVQETSDSFRFVAATDAVGEDVRADMVEIYPGVTKIVIRGANLLDLSLDELELDTWRFRLPASTRPELANAVYREGELVVTVPKGELLTDSDGDDGDDQEEVWAEGTGHLVLVQ
ncbi:uncharacterized protein LOC131155055 [Malania oleifera]|uniref:uncharacterized protein LOC131155055 n=1 Tax=Malania oleifera TaxID=397392 RepID=UPI0025AEC62F|nr:uncharacterized protein LOC131155055 [Malania oleifera]